MARVRAVLTLRRSPHNGRQPARYVKRGTTTDVDMTVRGGDADANDATTPIVPLTVSFTLPAVSSRLSLTQASTEGTGTSVGFGRDPTACHVAIGYKSAQGPLLSRRHCVIVARVVEATGAPQLLLCDLGSLNGTFASRRRVDKHSSLPLRLGSTVAFGAGASVKVAPPEATDNDVMGPGGEHYVLPEGSVTFEFVVSELQWLAEPPARMPGKAPVVQIEETPASAPEELSLMAPPPLSNVQSLSEHVRPSLAPTSMGALLARSQFDASAPPAETIDTQDHVTVVPPPAKPIAAAAASAAQLRMETALQPPRVSGQPFISRRADGSSSPVPPPALPVPLGPSPPTVSGAAPTTAASPPAAAPMPPSAPSARPLPTRPISSSLGGGTRSAMSVGAILEMVNDNIDSAGRQSSRQTSPLRLAASSRGDRMPAPVRETAPLLDSLEASAPAALLAVPPLRSEQMPSHGTLPPSGPSFDFGPARNVDAADEPMLLHAPIVPPASTPAVFVPPAPSAAPPVANADDAVVLLPVIKRSRASGGGGGDEAAPRASMTVRELREEVLPLSARDDDDVLVVPTPEPPAAPARRCPYRRAAATGACRKEEGSGESSAEDARL
jgi:hypothetical protein